MNKLLRFDVFFITLTALYWVLNLAGLGVQPGSGSHQTGLFLVNLLGLFVPLGPNNFVIVLIPGMGWAFGVFLLVVLLFGERSLRILGLHPVLKGVVNLVILFGITMMGDLIFFHTFASLYILLGEGF